MSASGKPGWDVYFPPQVPGFPKATLNDIESVRRLIGPQTVGIMLEPIQGEGGVNPATPAFLQALRALCDQHHLLLILDEVQTGCGRTGPLFAYQSSGIEPDIITLGKGLARACRFLPCWPKRIAASLPMATRVARFAAIL